jgi:hypothetical protein
MTTTVTGLTAQALSLNKYDILTTTVGLVLIGLLVLLLLVREIVSLLWGRDASRETRALDMALAPLLIVFAVVVCARLAELLS